MRPHRLLTALIATGLLAGLSSAARAESVASLFNGDRFSGPVPAGEVIRLKLFMVKGSQPRLRLTLGGFKGTLSFTGGAPGVPATELYDPDDDGNEQFETTLDGDVLDFRQSIVPGRSTLRLKGFKADHLPDGAPETGWYQLVIRTNNRLIPSTANGRYVSKRAKKVVLVGDETQNRLEVELVQGDQIKGFSVKRVGKAGDAPELDELHYPNGLVGTSLSQKRTKRGSKTSFPILVSPGGTGEGTFAYLVGYQTGGSAGPFKATLKVKPRKRNVLMPLQIRNAPGTPLSVRPEPNGFFEVNKIPNLNGFLDAESDVGVASDGAFLYVTGIKNGQLVLRRFSLDFEVIGLDFFNVWVIGDETLDMPGETFAEHRLLRRGDDMYATVTSASGNRARLYRFEIRYDDISGDTIFNVHVSRDVGSAGPRTSTDMFLAADDTTVSVGLFVGSQTVSHDVYRYDAETLVGVGTNPVPIGPPQLNAGTTSAAGVALRQIVDGGGDPVYELWAPDSLSTTGPSNLHRQEHVADWSALATPGRVYGFDYDGDGNFDVRTEHSPTAVTIDQDGASGVTPTGVTILHYVVPDDPATGRGTIHRRLFGVDGNEIPGSHFALSVVGGLARHPTSILVNSNASRGNVYVGYSTPNGPQVQRFPIVR